MIEFERYFAARAVREAAPRESASTSLDSELADYGSGLPLHAFIDGALQAAVLWRALRGLASLLRSEKRILLVPATREVKRSIILVNWTARPSLKEPSYERDVPRDSRAGLCGRTQFTCGLFYVYRGATSPLVSVTSMASARPVSVVMAGTGEYTTGYIAGQGGAQIHV